jgi:hypothetical protein
MTIFVFACSINLLKEMREDQQMIVNDPRFHGPIERWHICPSTHCERWQECRSPHECSGTGKNLTPEQRARLTPSPSQGRGGEA